jgi:hypothetical protein
MKGGEIKIKYANGGIRAENKVWDNYRFILLVRASHCRSMSKTVSIPEDLGRWCDWRNCRSRHGILDTSRKFHRKIFGCAGLLIGCHSILQPSVSWLRTTFHVLWQHLHTSYPSQACKSVDFSWTLSTFMLMIPLILSMVALTHFRKGFPRMIEVYRRGSISTTMKSTKVEESGTQSTHPLLSHRDAS